MKKIGVFGGTFSPIHNGHTQLAKHYLEALNLDLLLVIPTQQPPHKQPEDLLPGALRAKLCELAFEDEPKVRVSCMEIQRSGKSYTVDTIRQLRRDYPGAKLYLLVGSDMFLTFHQWKDWQTLLGWVCICTAARGFDEMKELAAMAKFLREHSGEPIVFDFPVLPLSSTEIRERLSKGEDCSAYLNQEVYSQILENHLYQKGQR